MKSSRETFSRLFFKKSINCQPSNLLWKIHRNISKRRITFLKIFTQSSDSFICQITTAKENYEILAFNITIDNSTKHYLRLPLILILGLNFEALHQITFHNYHISSSPRKKDLIFTLQTKAKVSEANCISSSTDRDILYHHLLCFYSFRKVSKINDLIFDITRKNQ